MPRRNAKATTGSTLDLGRRSVGNAKLLHLSDDVLLRNAYLAYEDGYADARTYGRNGKFIPEYFTADDRVKYLTGFAAGIRVFDLRKENLGI